jgi:diacylglycerol kinase
MRHEPADPEQTRTPMALAVPAAGWPHDDGPDGLDIEDMEAPAWAPRADRRGTSEKFAAGLRGLKHAIRGDSSFFAHAYRGTLIALTAALLSVSPLGWCLLVISACLVLLAELTHSAVDTLARAVGDPEDPRLKMAREIAAAGVLVAAVASGGLTTTVLVVKFGEIFGWFQH